MRIMEIFNDFKKSSTHSFFSINLFETFQNTVKFMVPLLTILVFMYFSIPKSNLIINIIVVAMAYIFVGLTSIESFRTNFEKDFIHVLNNNANYIWILDLGQQKIKIFYRHADYFADSQIGYVETLNDLLFLVHPDDRYIITDLIENNLKFVDEYFEIDIRIKGYGNSWKQSRVKGSLKRDNTIESQFLYGYAYITIDEDERLLLDSEKNIKKIIDKISNNYTIIEINKDGTFGKHLYANEDLTKMLNCTSEELTSKTPYEVCLNKDLVRKLESSKENEEVTHSFLCGKGNTRHVILKKDNAHINGKKVAIIRSKDITNIKNIELDIKKSEEMYRIFFEILPDAIFATENGVITYVNPAGVKMLKSNNREEILSRNLLSFIQPDYHDKLRDLKEKKESNYIEVLLTCDDGQQRNVEIAYSTFVDDISNAKTVVIIRDITKYVEAQEKMKVIIEKNADLVSQIIRDYKLKEELFSNLSHDFKTPLNIILGVVQLLRKFYEDTCVCDEEKIKRYLSIMNQNCFRLLRLINNLTDLVKSDTGYLNLNLESIDIVMLVEDLVTSVVEFVENKGIEIVFDTNVEEKIVSVDVEKIERTILNLLSNAIKNCKSGDMITVSLECTEESIKIMVKDTGSGIPKEKLNHIFERFTRFNKTGRESIAGSGIGLTLVKSFIDIHNGKISVESEVNVGTTFYIEIPYNQSKVKYEVENIKLKDPSIVAERINHELSDIYCN
ncbi:PAS domain-containing sensor histidine kinase [Clostridiaceae bacterium M8S5]|nr:PAS domain-containing sensor histidine kinase [Clostridiaceae bacterium M8S5]